MSDDSTPSRLDRLLTLRGQQEAVLASCDPPQFASLSAEYRKTLEQIEALAPPAAKKGTVLDELKARRARGAEASSSDRTSRQA